MSPDAAALVRAEWQTTLFGTVNRAALAGCTANWPLHPIGVRVHRNHGFEPVSSATYAFAAWNGVDYAWSIGAYDDSLAFDVAGAADVDVVWLDMARLQSDVPAAWLPERLRALRGATDNPILTLAWPLSPRQRDALANARIPGMTVVDLDPLAASLGERWLDERTQAISGTRLSNSACLHVARALACQWLPAIAGPPRKAIAVDLDGTLYRGVLGEDGPSGVVLTDGHSALQSRLRALREDGMLLALVSRNEPADVEALFATRRDFALKLQDFSAVEVSWDEKPRALARACDAMRIGADSVVFIDDNAGELAAVASCLPALTLHAREDATETLAALEHVAGVFRFGMRREDRLRADDLRAATARHALEQSALSSDAYLRSLDVRLDYALDRGAHLARMAELSAKTNQFNLALRRMTEAALARTLADENTVVVTIGLSDRLADSGIVGLVVGRKDGDAMRIEELCVSCRALGRRIEDTMLTQALLLMARAWTPQRVVFSVRTGPRNAPARDWLARYAGLSVDDEATEVHVPFARIAASELSPAIGIRVAA